MQNQHIKAIQALEVAIELGKTASEPREMQALVDCEFNLALLLNLAGWTSRAITLIDQALQTSQAIFYTTALPGLTGIKAMALFYQGKYAQAIATSLQGIQPAETMQNWRVAALFYLICARSEMARGNLDECWQYLQKARAVADSYGYREMIGEVQCVSGDIYLFLQDFPRAIEAYKLGVIEDRPSFETLNNFYRLGLATAAGGDVPSGQSILEKAIGAARQANLATIFLPAELALLRMRAETVPVEAYLPLLEAYNSEPRMAEIAQAGLLLRFIQLENTIRQHLTEEVETKSLALATWLEGSDSLIMDFYARILLLESYDHQDPIYRKARSRVKEILEEIRKHAQTDVIRPLFDLFYQETLKHYPEF
jgi:tetratricopeptide (TPR) repeat protein